MRSSAWMCACVASVAIACGGEDAVTTPAATGSTTGAGGAGASGGGSTGGAGTSTGGMTGSGGSRPIECPAMAIPAGEHQRNIMFDGNDREYEVQVPISYDNTAAVPLVLDMHGYTSNKEDQQVISGFSGLSEDNGFIVVRPNGFGNLRSWNAGDVCCGVAQNQGLDDVGLMKAIVAAVSAEACIDPRRVYATGLSNGGAMTHRLACEAADVFAAAAAVAYPIDFDPLDKCKPSRPIAVMHSHGKNDGIVPYGGSGTMHPVQDSFAYWASVNGCTGMPTTTYTAANSDCATYETCDAGVNVTLCSVNGGHVLYSNPDSVPVGELSWQFLSKFTLP